MFMYYRKDLLEKHKRRRCRRPGTRLMRHAQKIIMDGEKQPEPAGLLDSQGAPIEGTVCTYPRCRCWGHGQRPHRSGGKLNLDTRRGAPAVPALRPHEAGRRACQKNIAEIPTDRIRIDLQAGNVIFAMSWGYVWNRLENDADSKVKGKVGVAPPAGTTRAAAAPPASAAGRWAVSRVLEEQAGGGEVRPLPVVARGRRRCRRSLASHLPVFPSVYKDPEVLKAEPVVRRRAASGRSRASPGRSRTQYPPGVATRSAAT
ncbi:MAG: hypothetical protein MZV49_09020 [Rhodopseudomonas palustris]|nr:hypothetical protein [Rhodopseudomonas palustris]